MAAPAWLSSTVPRETVSDPVWEFALAKVSPYAPDFTMSRLPLSDPIIVLFVVVKSMVSVDLVPDELLISFKYPKISASVNVKSDPARSSVRLSTVTAKVADPAPPMLVLAAYLNV